MKYSAHLLAILMIAIYCIEPTSTSGAPAATRAPGHNKQPLEVAVDESRIAIGRVQTPGDSESLFVIRAPGSYYLTANVTGVAGKHGITIAADDVTLDLNGFVMTGVPAAGSGVIASRAQTNITVVNGTLAEWPYDGVSLQSVSGGSVRGVKARRNGNIPVKSVYGSGIATGHDFIVRDCVVTASYGNGISVGSNSVVNGCISTGNRWVGIYSGNNSMVTACNANGGEFGIVGASACTVSGCSIKGGMIGIFVPSDASGGRIDGNQVSGGEDGIWAIGTNTCITRNTVTGCVRQNYRVAEGNDFGPIGSVATSVSPWANISL